MGYTDAQGVYRYAEDDYVTPFSAFMNLGQESVSQALENVRAEMNATPAAASAPPVGAWTTHPTNYVPELVVKGGMCHLTSGLYITAVARTIPAGVLETVARITAGTPLIHMPDMPVFGTGVVFAESTTPVPVYVVLEPDGDLRFSSAQAITFTGAGGETASVRIPTITWRSPWSA